MALPISSAVPPTSKASFTKPQCFSQICSHLKQSSLSSPMSISFPIPTPNFSSSRVRVIICHAAKSQTEPVKKRSSSASNKKKKKKGKGGADDGSQALELSDVEIVDDFSVVEDGPSSSSSSSSNSSLAYHPTPLPRPPAGFVVDDQGKVLMASNKRLATLVSFFPNIISMILY